MHRTRVKVDLRREALHFEAFFAFKRLLGPHQGALMAGRTNAQALRAIGDAHRLHLSPDQLARAFGGQQFDQLRALAVFHAAYIGGQAHRGLRHAIDAALVERIKGAQRLDNAVKDLDAQRQFAGKGEHIEDLAAPRGFAWLLG